MSKEERLLLNPISKDGCRSLLIWNKTKTLPKYVCCTCNSTNIRSFWQMTVLLGRLFCENSDFGSPKSKKHRNISIKYLTSHFLYCIFADGNTRTILGYLMEIFQK